MPKARELEPLEPRRLCAATLSSGLLTVTGTSYSDTITFFLNPANLAELDVKIGATTSRFPLASVKGIVAFGYRGNDLIQISQANGVIALPTTMYGGGGNDSLLGGAGKDYLRGDEGNDAIQGVAGNDTLLGGDGNDFISGGKNNDDVSGEDGTDSVSGGTGIDTFHTGDAIPELL